MASARPPSVSPQARLSYLAISSILRGRHSHRPPVVCLAHRPSTLPVRRPFSTALRRTDGNGSYMRSDFANQGFTGYYEPREQTPGPLSGSSPTGAPRITPKLLKDHLDAFVVGQDRAKKALATAVYNHYQRIQELQRREEEEEELLAQQERRRMSDVHRHPVEGREGELKRGIRVPSLTADWPEEDEFPGQQATTSSSAIHMPSPGSVQKGGEWGPGGYVQSQQRQQQQQQQQSRHTSGIDDRPGLGSQGLVDNTPLTIEKSNILLLGPSGVGKTLMAKTLARVLEVPFSMSDCTPFTQAGYIGEDAEVCVQRLLAAANYDVARAERGIICLDEMDKIATAKVSHGKDVSGEGVQQALLKIIEGTTVQVQAKPERGSGSGSPGASAGRQQGFPTNSPLSGGSMGGSHSQSSAAPGKGEVYNVKTDNILFICAGAFNGLHKLILDRISKGSIGFGATVRASPGTNSTSSSNQHETVLEGEDDLFTNHLPFYSASPSPTSSSSSSSPRPHPRKLNTLDLVEPQDLQTYGLIPELVGRIPLTCALSSLDIASLVQVLTEPRNSLLQQYRQLFALSSIELRITTPALHVIAAEAQKMGTGARGLRTVLERLLADAMFETPGSGVKSVLVTEEVARKRRGAVFFGRGEGEGFREVWAREEERWEVEEEERRRRARRELESIYESERAQTMKEREERKEKEEEMQASMQRMKETLAQREMRAGLDDGSGNSGGGGAGSRPSASRGSSFRSGPPTPNPQQGSESGSGGQFAPPGGLQRSDSRSSSKLVMQKDKIIEGLRLELAEAQIKLVEVENMGGGRMQDLQRQMYEVKMQNARLMEENESFQLLLTERTLHGEFSNSEFLRPPSNPEGSRPPSRQPNQGGASLADELNGEDVDASFMTTTTEGGASAGTTTDDQAKRFQGEISSLKDQNKALTLYINNIISRLLQHEQFETILDKTPDLMSGGPNSNKASSQQARGGTTAAAANTDKDLPPPPPPKDEIKTTFDNLEGRRPQDSQPADEDDQKPLGFLQRAKSVMSGGGSSGGAGNRASRPRPVTQVPSASDQQKLQERIRAAEEEKAAAGGGVTENPDTAPRVPLGGGLARAGSVRGGGGAGHRRANSDWNAAGLVGNMFKGASSSSSAGAGWGGPLSPGLTSPTGSGPGGRNSFFGGSGALTSQQQTQQQPAAQTSRVPSGGAGQQVPTISETDGGSLGKENAFPPSNNSNPPDQSESDPSSTAAAPGGGNSSSSTGPSSPPRSTTSSGERDRGGAVMMGSKPRPLRLVQEAKEDEAASKKANRGSWFGWMNKGTSGSGSGAGAGGAAGSGRSVSGGGNGDV